MMNQRLKQAALWALLTAFGLAGLNASAAEDEDDEEEEDDDVEEMVVTGSYIRRNNFDLPSPRDIVDAVDISLSGTSDIGDIVFDQTFQIGVNANSAPSEFHSADDQQFQQGAETWANLRGLGTRATMTMMDGHRVPAQVNGFGSATRRAGSDLNNLYPSIAIGRMETILDGASALYGASAVSGVINFVPRKDFDGLMMSYEYQQPFEDGAPASKLSLLAGAQGERTSVIFALEIRDQDRMKQTDRPDYVLSSANWTGQYVDPYQERPWSLPGEFTIPVRDTTGDLQAHPSGGGWYRVPGADQVWGRSDGWLAGRYSPTRAGVSNFVPPAGPSGGVFSPLYPARDTILTPFANETGVRGRVGDNFGDIWTAKRQDPGCGYAFGGGNDKKPFLPPFPLDHWTRDVARQTTVRASAGDGSNSVDDGYHPFADHPLLTVVFGDPVANVGYTDAQKPGNFLNGFMTGELDGLSAWKGEEVDMAGNRQDCRMVIGDTVDIREQRESEQAMAYFEHEFNDYVKIRGELVAGRLDYNTRQYAVRLDDWGENITRGPNSAMVIGSNPGNPYRAYADGSNACDYMPGLQGCDEWNARRSAYQKTVTGALGADSPFAPTGMADSYLNYVDANGNGRYDYLEEAGEMLLYAQDANGDGIPDRMVNPGMEDTDGDGVPDSMIMPAMDADGFIITDPTLQKNPDYRVILLSATTDSDGDGIPDRFDPDMMGAGGARLFEDVRVYGQNLWPKQPYNNNIPWLNDDMTWRDRSQVESFRIRLGTEVSIPDTDWVVDADWVWSLSRRTDDFPEGLWPMTLAALRCQAGPFADQCWNPFSTAWLDTTEEGEIQPAWRDPNADEVNTELENRYAGIVLTQTQRTTGMYVIDLVSSNNALMDLWYNDTPIGIAAGIHWRLETEEFVPDAFGGAGLGINAANWDPWSGNASVNYQRSEEEARAAFVEFQVTPLAHDFWGTMEIQAAARYAEFIGRGGFTNSTAKFDTLIPKLALRYQPTEWLAFRGSVTEGFILPGMYQLFQTGAAGRAGIGLQTITDYICNDMPEINACVNAQDGGGIEGVSTPDSENINLSAETSELWNAGISLQFLEGDLNFDVDYTTVDFNGRVERMSAGENMSAASIGFRPFVQDFVQGCAGVADTLLDYDDRSQPGAITVGQYLGQATAQELACRVQAAQAWVATEEGGIGGTSVIRSGIDGLELRSVGSPWLNQGQQTTTSVIYGARYRFDAEALPFIGGDYGSFQWTMSATQMLENSIQKYSQASGHRWADIRVDGVGYRNNAVHYQPLWPLYANLPATPEWRINMNLRWFYGDHIAQLGVRWHDELSDVMSAWDEVRDFYDGDIGASGVGWVNGRDFRDIEESEACVDQDRNPHCRIDSRHYWDLSYTYMRPDVYGFGYVQANVAVRNIFNTMPDPMMSGVGYDAYLDNIMGRIGFVRLTVGF